MSPMQILMQMMSGGNPQAMLQNAMQRNPQLQAILNQQKQSGMSMEQYVRQVAKQQNVDIEPMLNMLRQRGIK
ncbi:MAG: hypothetical protein J6S85_00895 [Methanobrevibacter sp.]|nr:hypothetical protein [Methanobrevibacter sp.]MBO7712089.1 hypothetical protein [Methanobrevibacter sp.]